MNEMINWIKAEGEGHWLFIAFPVALLCLFIWLKGRRLRFLIPSLLLSVAILNPVFYKKWTDLGLYAYWRILWVVPVIPTVAALIPSIAEKTTKPWAKAAIAAAGTALIILGGTFLYKGPGGNFSKAANAAKLPEAAVQAADRLLELEDRPRAVFQYPIGTYLRQYTGEIDQLYGRNIDGYIMSAGSDAWNVHTQLTEGNLEAVATAMANDGYEYLVADPTGREDVLIMAGFEQLGTAAGYGIYRAHGKPALRKERNELGQVLSVTAIDENGDPIKSINGYASVSYEYDNGSNVIKQSFMDETGALVISPSGYAEVRRIYEGNHLIYEAYYGPDGNPLKQLAGYVAIAQKWDGDTLLSRTYLDPDGNETNREDEFSKAVWRQEGTCTNLHFYNAKGQEVGPDSLNLAGDVRIGEDGWSEWMVPVYNTVNSCQGIGWTNLGPKAEGDVYTSALEIEFKGVTVTPGQQLRFWAQGAQDGRWFTGSVWNGNLINLIEAPADGLYAYTSTVTVSADMANVSTFDLGFRCDYWASGMFRVRKVKVEKGDTATAWVAGL